MGTLDNQIKNNILSSFKKWRNWKRDFILILWLNRKLGRVGKEYAKNPKNDKNKEKFTFKSISPKNTSVKQLLNKKGIASVFFNGEVQASDFVGNQSFNDYLKNVQPQFMEGRAGWKSGISIKFKDGTEVKDVAKFVRESIGEEIKRKELTSKNLSPKEFFNKNKIESTSLGSVIQRQDFNKNSTFKDIDHQTLNEEMKRGTVRIKFKDGTYISDLKQFLKDSNIKYNENKGKFEVIKDNKNKKFFGFK